MKKLCCLLFFASQVFSGISAQVSLELTSDQAVELALEKNLGVQGESLKLEIKAREKDFVWNKFLPSISSSATLSRSHVETKVSGLIPVQEVAPGMGLYDRVAAYSVDVNPVNLSTNINLQLPLSLALFRGIQQTILDYEGAALSLEGAKEKLARDVRKSFYTVLALQESLALGEKQLESARLRFIQTQASFRSGLAPELSVLQSQVAWENRKPALEDQRLGYRQTLLNLKNILGIPLETEIVLKGSIDVPRVVLDKDDSQLVRDFLDRRLDLAGLEAQQNSLNNMVKLQEEALWPVLVLMASLDPGLNDPLNGKSWESAENWKQRGGMVGVSLSWKLDSLIPGSTSWVQIENVKTQAAQLEISRQQALRGAAMEVKILLAKLKKSIQSLQTLDLSVALARKAYEMSEAAYRSGSQSLLEVRDAELQLQGSQLQVLNEKLNFNNGLLDLEGALGTPWREFFKETDK